MEHDRHIHDCCQRERRGPEEREGQNEGQRSLEGWTSGRGPGRLSPSLAARAVFKFDSEHGNEECRIRVLQDDICRSLKISSFDPLKNEIIIQK